MLGYLVRLDKPKPATQVIAINPTHQIQQRDDNLEVAAQN